MAGRIHGITIQLQELTEIGVDAFNVPVMVEAWADVPDVIVGQPTDAEQIDAMDLYGSRAVYILGIPKGDTHEWKAGNLVRFFGETFRIFGHTIQGIEDMVPLQWNKKVMVAHYGESTDSP
jgi:hypothetical protein